MQVINLCFILCRAMRPFRTVSFKVKRTFQLISYSSRLQADNIYFLNLESCLTKPQLVIKEKLLFVF